MDLLERYLYAVGRYLPMATKEDTLAELRANLLEQMDAHAEELGRPLTDDEIADTLRGHGNPAVVALRYLPQRSLIGPTIFPFYLLTLRPILAVVLLIYFITYGVKLIATGDTPGAWATGIVHALLGVIPVLLVNAAIITLIFAIIEVVHRKRYASTASDAWDPEKLSPLPAHSRPKPAASRIADLVFHCLWMLYVLEIPHHPYLIVGPGAAYLSHLSIGWAPVWHVFYAAFVVLLVLQLGIKIARLFGSLGRWKAALSLLESTFGVLTIGWLAFAGTYLIGTGPGADLHTLAIVNHWIGVSMRIVLLFALLDLAQGAWKYGKTLIPAERLIA